MRRSVDSLRRIAERTVGRLRPVGSRGVPGPGDLTVGSAPVMLRRVPERLHLGHLLKRHCCTGRRTSTNVTQRPPITTASDQVSSRIEIVSAAPDGHGPGHIGCYVGPPATVREHAGGAIPVRYERRASRGCSGLTCGPAPTGAGGRCTEAGSGSRPPSRSICSRHSPPSDGVGICRYDSVAFRGHPSVVDGEDLSIRS